MQKKINKLFTLSGWIIVNKYGGLWTDRLFLTEKGAKRHLDNFWGKTKHDDFSIVFVSGTLKPTPPTEKKG